MQPPSPAVPAPPAAPFATVIMRSRSDAPVPTVKSRTACPPDRVTRWSPSRVRLPAIAFVVVTTIVTGAAPQLNVIVPPTARAAFSAASVQLAALPVPTTASARARAGVSSAAAPSTASANACRAMRADGVPPGIRRCQPPASRDRGADWSHAPACSPARRRTLADEQLASAGE
jgi:hypothetical protein